MTTFKYPLFVNNSGLPINLETWQRMANSGVETLVHVLVEPGEKITLASTNGEWYLQTYLDKEMSDEWKTSGLKPGVNVGKFRNKPCALGKYSWMNFYDSPFEITYDPVNNIATFVKIT